MKEHKEPIPSMIYNAAVGGHVTNSQQIIDENENKEQSQINAEIKEALGTGGSVDNRIAEEGAKHYLKEETYSKSELNNIITTPNQEYVSVTATAETTSVTDVLPSTGAADTTYRVGNWDGTQYNDSVFSEYAWNGSAYIKLSTKSQIGEIYDISANHADTKYANLIDALGTNGDNIPPTLRKGGMTIKFVQSSDNKYAQFRLRSHSWTTNISDWYDETELICSKSIDIPTDIDISDENYNIIARFKNGHFKTEKFDSEETNQKISENENALKIRPYAIPYGSYYIDFVDESGITGARIPLGFDGTFKLPYVIIDKNGHGKYTSITSASANEPNDTVFLIMPGVYENEVVDCKNKRQYFIGVEREHVIVRNYIGDYNYPPFNIAAGLLKNMTIIAAAEEGVDVSIRSTPTIADRGVYAVHTDWHTAKNDNFTIDNCTLISDWFAAWGIGMRNGCHMYGRNSLFVSNYGFAVGCHDNNWNIAQYDGEQHFHLIDCVLHATDGVYPALFLNSRARNDEVWVRNSMFYIEMIKTLLKSEGNASTYDIGNGYPVVITPEDFLGLKNGRLIDTSWGNSETVFNV